MMMNEGLNERRGIIFINRSDIENKPEQVLEIMKKIVIMKAEYIHDKDGFEYNAISPYFARIQDSQPPKKYVVDIHRINNSTTYPVEFVQQEPKKRLGKFSIYRAFMENNFDLVARVMGKCVIVGCVYCGIEDRYEYTAISGFFREIEAGDQIPLYRVVVNDDGSTSFA